jgi:hypothetical protein
MPSTRGFTARRRGVRDSRLPPVRNDASTDCSVQYGEAFTPARPYAGYTIDIALHGLTGVKAWAACGGRGGSRRAAGGSAVRGPEVRSCSSRALTSEGSTEPVTRSG